MSTLLLHDREVPTYFDLMGHRENDMTAALGWGISQSPALLQSVVAAVTDLRIDPAEAVIRLQEHHATGGFTDVEILVPDVLHLIMEAKRGWNLPTADQLEHYAQRFQADATGIVQSIVVLTQWGATSVVERQLPVWPFAYPRKVLGWGDLVGLTEAAARRGPLAERRTLRELATYLRGVADMRDTNSNSVFVVALGSRMGDDWPVTNIQIVEDYDRYWFPASGKNWPKVPPNYMGFRYYGRLQAIRHVDSYVIETDISRQLPAAPSREWEPHFVLTLGPAIRPDHDVPTGRRIQRSARVWVDIDLLLIASSISEAWELSKQRQAAT
jgi:hypothetical protein